MSDQTDTRNLAGEMLALAERCEAATRGDRELDGDIYCDLGLAPFVEGAYDAYRAPAYTASLDAALALVPEGVGINIERYWIAKSDGPVWSAEIATGGLPDKPRQVFDCYDAATPALAVTAVALRALASEQPPC